MITIAIIPRLEVPGDGEIFGCSTNTFVDMSNAIENTTFFFASRSMDGLEADVLTTVGELEDLDEPAFIGIFVDGNRALAENIFFRLESRLFQHKSVAIRQEVLDGMKEVVVLEASDLIQGKRLIKELERGETS